MRVWIWIVWSKHRFPLPSLGGEIRNQFGGNFSQFRVMWGRISFDGV
jgi:hypothetical protein